MFVLWFSLVFAEFRFYCSYCTNNFYPFQCIIFFAKKNETFGFASDSCPCPCLQSLYGMQPYGSPIRPQAEFSLPPDSVRALCAGVDFFFVAATLYVYLSCC